MRRALAGLCFAILFAASGPMVWAQDAPSRSSVSSLPALDQTPAAERETREKVAQRLEQIQANSELDEVVKTELLKKYKAAQDWFRGADEVREKSN